jgi:hypothetical protein
MSLKAGDKVRFLDETGQGTITRFIDNRQVLVEMEDGFEIPYPLAKLVPAEAERIAVLKTQAAPQAIQENKVIEYRPAQQGLHTDGVFLVYQPKDPQYPTGGHFSVSIFNMTAYHVQFTIATRYLGKYTCERVGTLDPRESCLLREIQPADIERWSALLAELLFYSYEPFTPREPISRTLKQKPAKFYKESSFTSGGLTAHDAIVVDLSRAMQKGQEEEFFDEKDLVRIVQDKEQKIEKRQSKQSEKNNSALEWEVDLHLEELVDSIRGMTNAQMIDTQLRHVHKKLDEAYAANIRKIVFIHGVGNGRLKQEIRKILATHKDLQFYDASYSTYGFGATEVAFK